MIVGREIINGWDTVRDTTAMQKILRPSEMAEKGNSRGVTREDCWSEELN